MTFDFAHFQVGAIAFLLAFALAGTFAIVFKLIYSAVTPYNERELLKSGNLAAPIVLAGALLGYVLALASALSNTASLLEFAAWAALSGAIQIIAFLIVRQVVLPNVKQHIENDEIGPAIYLASISIAVGILNAACMTY